eukprot:3944646-Prymnesium_polylepis.1
MAHPVASTVQPGGADAKSSTGNHRRIQYRRASGQARAARKFTAPRGRAWVWRRALSSVSRRRHQTRAPHRRARPSEARGDTRVSTPRACFA